MSRPPEPGRVTRAALLPLALFLGACYSYGAPHGPAPAPGSHVSLRLFKAATDSLALVLGPGVVYVEGVVVRDDSAGLVLAVKRVEGREARSSLWSGERVTFPHGVYAEVQERRLSLPGTVLVGGLAVGAVVVMYGAFGTPASNSQGGGITGSTQ